MGTQFCITGLELWDPPALMESEGECVNPNRCTNEKCTNRCTNEKCTKFSAKAFSF